ncbi:hypothetical protein PtB15_11B172 [Puccinia triticina]|nr:hypothetical protein PtB15_11B172 [Puccinia triticina]
MDKEVVDHSMAMDEEVDHSPGEVLCPETMPEEVIARPPREAVVHIDYQLFVQVRPAPPPPGSLSVPLEWRKITPGGCSDRWTVDINSMTWAYCQAKVINQIVARKPFLVRYFGNINEAKKIAWYGVIDNDMKYHLPNGFQIQGQLDFLGFATNAYDAYPSRVGIRLVMQEPLNHHDDRPPEAFVGRAVHQTPTNATRKRKYSLPDIPTIPTKAKGSRLPAKHNQEDHFKDIEVLDPTTGLYGAVTPLRHMPKDPVSATSTQIDMALYLKVAHLPESDEITRARLLLNGIVKWTFFLLTSEAELREMGFPIGTRRLLTTGVSNLHRHLVESQKPGTKKEGHLTGGEASTSTNCVALCNVDNNEDLETYLCLALIYKDDQLTRARLMIHGIVHWSFFSKSLERELTRLGFPLGTSCQLMQGVKKMQITTGLGASDEKKK